MAESRTMARTEGWKRTEGRTVTRKDPAALRRVVDLALHGLRTKARTARAPHWRHGQVEVRWVMSSSGVIDSPAQPPEA
jgi:hypothetical protein